MSETHQPGVPCCHNNPQKVAIRNIFGLDNFMIQPLVFTEALPFQPFFLEVTDDFADAARDRSS